MADRVLNFSEFSDKYSKEAEQDSAASYQDFSKSSDNFVDGFDDSTYDQPQLGPTRPVDHGLEETPIQPGEEGAPSFSSKVSNMEIPEDEEEGEEVEEIEDEEVEDEEEREEVEEVEDEEEGEEVEDEEMDDDGGYPEDDEDDEEDEEDEEDEVKESFDWSSLSRKNLGLVEGFGSFSNSHSHDMHHELNHMENEIDDYGDDEPCMVICNSCGSEREIEAGLDPMSKEEYDNPDSWWRGTELGMQCGYCMSDK